MSQYSEMQERLQRFHEQFPNGTRADWLDFCLKEQTQGIANKEDVDKIAANMIAHYNK